MQCEAPLHTLLTREGIGGFKKGDKGTDFVSALQLRACEAKFKPPLVSLLDKSF